MPSPRKKDQPKLLEYKKQHSHRIPKLTQQPLPNGADGWPKQVLIAHDLSKNYTFQHKNCSKNLYIYCVSSPTNFYSFFQQKFSFSVNLLRTLRDFISKLSLLLFLRFSLSKTHTDHAHHAKPVLVLWSTRVSQHRQQEFKAGKTRAKKSYAFRHFLLADPKDPNQMRIVYQADSWRGTCLEGFITGWCCCWRKCFNK